jgi:tRNA nucleotidyltransferase (CCA-adding enzyme)
MNEMDIIRSLVKYGFEALEVGGCVRDFLLNRQCKDIDITTNATPDQVMSLFKSLGCGVGMVGKKYAVVLVDGVEVASYRMDTYVTRSKPDVTIAKTFLEDSSRRDFTINAMGRTPDGVIIDHHGGKRDLRAGLIRCVGDPDQRFNEDPSRILRALELASRLGFKIENRTKISLMYNRHLLQHVPSELIGKIVKKVIGNKRLSNFLILLRDTGILQFVFPELVHTVGSPQNPRYHRYDVFMHIVSVIRAAEKRNNPKLILGALLHDVVKGLEGIRGISPSGQPNDLGHEEAGVPVAQSILRRLELDRWLVRDVLFLVMFHGLSLEATPKKSACIRALRRMAPYYKTKKDLNVALTTLFVFMNCDAEGFNRDFCLDSKRQKTSFKPFVFEALRSTVIYRSDLPITGKDLVGLGFDGKEVGEILDKLIELNFRTRDEIMSYIARIRKA